MSQGSPPSPSPRSIASATSTVALFVFAMPMITSWWRRLCGRAALLDRLSAY
jgi:hypothetical protein